MESFAFIPGNMTPPIVCGQFCTVVTAEPWLLEPDRAVTAIEYAIQNEDVIVGLNVSFDMALVVNHRPDLLVPVWNHYRKGLVRDVAVRQKLLDIASGELKFHDEDDEEKPVKTKHSMQALAKRLLGIHIEKGEKTWRKRYGELYGIPFDQWPEDARRYALDDASITRALFFTQNNGQPLTNEKEQTICAWALHLCSIWGLRTDPVEVERIKSSLMEQRTKGRKALIEAGFYKGVPFTSEDAEKGKTPDFYGEYKAKHLKDKPRPMKWGKDTKKIQAHVVKQFKRHGWEVPKTEGGDISTEKDVLERSGSYLLRKLADLGALDKVLQTYIPAMEVGTTVPINPGYNVLVATGRTSSFKPNIQNVPAGRREGQDIRQAFVPRPGFVFCSIDYSTLELRALAHWCEVTFGWSKMADALRAGKDLHLQMAADMMGITYEEAQTRYDAGDKEVKKYRSLSKPADFGFPGGMSPRTLVTYARKSYGVTMDEPIAFQLKDTFLRRFSEMELYFRLHAALPGLDHGEARYEQLYSGRVRGGMSFCDACNGRFQGLSADGFKAAFVEVCYEMYCVPESPLYGCRPSAPIHDEVISEMPADRYEECVRRKDEIMKAEMSKYMPTVPMETSPAVMERWYKEAEEVYSPDGRLIPWRPDAHYDQDKRLVTPVANGRKYAKWLKDRRASA